MAKSKTPPTTAKPRKLAGKTVAFVGKFGYKNHHRDAMAALVAAEGGTVVEAEKAAPDYLVAGDGVGGNPPAAVAKVQKKHPQITVIDRADFYRLVNPTADEFRELMLSGPHGHEFWNTMQTRLQCAGVVIDLRAADFRTRSVAGTLYKVCLDGSDFRGATISACFDEIKGATFDGATFSGGSFSNAEDCSLKNVTMSRVRWNPAKFVGCDFSGAKLKIACGSYTTTTDCTFKKADLTGAELWHSTFSATDFTAAVLAGARLAESVFSGVDLSGADLSRADLRNAKFDNAILRKATFTDANLSGADLTGATIDGADFTGAITTGATLTGLDRSKAKNLEQTAARTAGPNMLELANVASGSKRLLTSIEFDLGNNESVALHPSVSTYTHGTQTHVHSSANYTVCTHNSTACNYVTAPSFVQGMLNLVDMWSRGTPKFDTVKVEAKQATLRGKELKDLAVRAWYEACGIPVPSADELEKASEQAAAGRARLREEMLAELGGGPAGVKKWNERSAKVRGELGKLRKHDFTNAKLAGAALGGLDLEGCTFDGANLKRTNFWQSQLKGASFTRADMSEANLACVKCPEASFEGAVLTKCNLRAANFRRCTFQAADLTGSEFHYSDVCGADFTGATLDGVEFMNTKFDETTVFPPGFVPPDGLEWKGAGPRPGTAPPPPPPTSGTLDFEAFLRQLNTKVESARMEKAGSMLKAERFQLFAEVKDESLVGVVKSQSSKDLVYSCRLAADGSFGCCTQNLRPCGGLRGALCKHLLVLIVGLAKAEQLDSATVDHWIDLSRRKKPAIDEDTMSATFLRYKGAEAGEVDWRPTETIPEDFYAM